MVCSQSIVLRLSDAMIRRLGVVCVERMTVCAERGRTGENRNADRDEA